MDREKLLDIYTRTMRVARSDEKFRSLLMTGKLAVLYYTYRGQELASAAMMAALEPTDYLVTTYRGQHDQIAKGVPLDLLYAFVDFGGQVGQPIPDGLDHLKAWSARVAARPSAATSADPANGV